MQDTIEVREGEALDEKRLLNFLRKEINDLPTGELKIRQFRAGLSNLTYFLKVDDWEAVLRRPPLGPVAPKAHDMEREFNVIGALSTYFAAAPKPILFTKDESIIGSPFFVMERKNGIVLDTHFPEGTSNQEDIARRISEIMVEELVKLHAIPYKNTPLANMVKPEGFLERQVHGWIGRYEKAKTENFEAVSMLTKWLIDHLPPEKEATVIHYDFKFNNAMFSEDYTELIGLFDWEMATVGDPLADLGVAMSYWMHADDPKMLLYGLGNPPITVLPGFFTREQFIESYAQKSGRDVRDIDYYLTFAYFKLAVICQQIYYRYVKGQTKDKRFARMNQMVEILILQASKGIVES